MYILYNRNYENMFVYPKKKKKSGVSFIISFLPLLLLDLFFIFNFIYKSQKDLSIKIEGQIST